jgi:hypothetical protein
MGKAKRGARYDLRERVADVVAIIGRKARNDEIERAIVAFGSKHPPDRKLWPWPPWPLNTRDKKIAQSLGWAIDRLQKQLRRHDTGGVISRALHGEHQEFSEWEKRLEHWRERLAIFGGTAPPNTGTLFGYTPKTWPLGRPKPSADRFVRKHGAVATAATILESHGLHPTATRKSDTRNASVFCRVAAVVYGDKNADLYHQCRTFLKARNRVPN